MGTPNPNGKKLPNAALYAMAGSSKMTPAAIAASKGGGPFTNKGPTSHPMQLYRNFQPTEEEKAKQEEARLAKERAKKCIYNLFSLPSPSSSLNFKPPDYISTSTRKYTLYQAPHAYPASKTKSQQYTMGSLNDDSRLPGPQHYAIAKSTNTTVEKMAKAASKKSSGSEKSSSSKGPTSHPRQLDKNSPETPKVKK
ncbi:hypothetical protein HBI18_042240 [Parastagonospora nodorum]|nr:hypothetical protein HBI18_042240 [Parastagonospora nodorum]